MRFDILHAFLLAQCFLRCYSCGLNSDQKGQLVGAAIVLKFALALGVAFLQERSYEFAAFHHILLFALDRSIVVLLSMSLISFQLSEWSQFLPFCNLVYFAHYLRANSPVCFEFRVWSAALCAYFTPVLFCRMIRLVSLVLAIQQLETVSRYAATELNSPSFARLITLASVLNFEVQVL